MRPGFTLIIQMEKTDPICQLITKNPKLQVFQRRENHAKGFMVWAGVSFYGKTKLYFIKPGVKINSTYYINNVLKPFLAYDAKKLFSDGNYVFHQDSAPSHVSKKIQDFMDKNFNYLKKEEWLPKTPDAAPMDYFVWGYLKRLLFKSRVKDMEGFKSALKRAWNKIHKKLSIKH